jgi:hypothetical protein
MFVELWDYFIKLFASWGETTEVFALMDIPDRWKTSAAENQRKHGLDRDGFSGYLQSLNAMIRNLMIMNQFPHVFYGQFDKNLLVRPICSNKQCQTQLPLSNGWCYTPVKASLLLKPKKIQTHSARISGIQIINGSTTWLLGGFNIPIPLFSYYRFHIPITCSFSINPLTYSIPG